MHTHLLRLIVSSLVAAVSIGSLAAGSVEAATITPRAALLARINTVRVEHGLRRVYPSTQLRGAAQRHSLDMLARGYFAHTSPTGSTVYARITNSGFVAGYSFWLGGETLAWGTGTLAGARATVHAWMESPDHRAILLSPTWRWVGVSRECGRYHGYPNACVWTTDWVARS